LMVEETGVPGGNHCKSLITKYHGILHTYNYEKQTTLNNNLTSQITKQTPIGN
jgi:hypothetical protein